MDLGDLLNIGDFFSLGWRGVIAFLGILAAIGVGVRFGMVWGVGTGVLIAVLMGLEKWRPWDR